MNAKGNKATLLNSQSASAPGYSGGILGSPFKFANWSLIAVPFRNNLSEEPNIHWHGLLVPTNMDGHPKNMV